MIDDSVRVCLLCKGKIPKWKSKGTKFCNPGCKFKFEKQEKEKRIAANPKTTTGNILHQCLSNALDARVPCKCRKRISDEDAKKLVAKGGAVDYTTRAAVFIEGQPLLITGKHLKFPRAATIEKAHISRATQDIFTIKGKVRIKERSIEEMQKAVAEDKLARSEEEALRMDIYGWLTAEAWRALIVEVPAEEYDRAEREARGRCLFSFADERSSAGVDVPPGFETFDRWDAEEPEPETETETESVEEEPEREDETEAEHGDLSIVTVEEMAGVEI
jgi:hypothetical protein